MPTNLKTQETFETPCSPSVKSIPPNTENSMQYGYDENDNNNIAMRLSARPITASTTSGTTCATSTSPSTTPMTMLTSTFAWCTPCVERARRAHSFTLDVVSHLIGSRSESCHKHIHCHAWAHLLDSPLPFYFHLFFPVFSFYLLHSELYPELDNLIVMESLCYSANKGSDDAYDVSTSLTKPFDRRSWITITEIAALLREQHVGRST